MGDRPADVRPRSNIYTVLVIVAFVLVTAATAYLAARSQQLFGTWNPLSGV
jgi:hypothetical protein